MKHRPEIIVQKIVKKFWQWAYFLYNTQALKKLYAGVAQLARASAFQAEGCEFESHHPLHFKKSKYHLWDLLQHLSSRETEILKTSSLGGNFFP